MLNRRIIEHEAGNTKAPPHGQQRLQAGQQGDQGHLTRGRKTDIEILRHFPARPDLSPCLAHQPCCLKYQHGSSGLKKGRETPEACPLLPAVEHIKSLLSPVSGQRVRASQTLLKPVQPHFGRHLLCFGGALNAVKHQIDLICGNDQRRAKRNPSTGSARGTCILNHLVDFGCNFCFGSIF